MKKIILVLLLLLFLTACGAPSEDVIYEDVVSILEDDLMEDGIASPEFSSQRMTEFEDLGDGLYEVKGKFEVPFDGMYSYSMKIRYDGDEWDEYEWIAE